MLQPNQMENEHEVEVTKLQIHHCTLYESSSIHEFLTSSTQKMGETTKFTVLLENNRTPQL